MTKKEMAYLSKMLAKANPKEIPIWEKFTEAEKALLWLEYIGFPNHNELIKRMRES